MTDEASGKALTVERPRVSNIQPLFDSDHFEHFQRAASALMHSTLLKESVRAATPQQCFSNLMLIFDQADRLGLPATVVAQNVDVVYGQLVYRGVLVAAIIEAKLGKLHRHYTGERGTDAYRVYVCDQDFAGMSEAQLAALAPGKYPRGWRIVDGSVGDWKTWQKKDGNAPRQPNPAWTGQATQNQLGYRGDREWARHYEPGILLGIFSDDEIQAFEDRQVVSVVDIADAPRVIHTGMTRPAAETIDGETGEVTQAGPLAGADGQTSDDAAEGGKSAEASPGAAGDGKKKPSAAEKRAAAAVFNAAGKAAGLADEPNVPPPFLNEEEATHWSNGWTDGSHARLHPRQKAANAAALERTAELTEGGEALAEADGYAVGLKGGDCVTPLGAEQHAGAWRSGWTRGDGERKAAAEVALAQKTPPRRQAAAPPPADDADKTRKGNALEAYELGHEAGMAGRDGAVPREWGEFPEDWSEGWNAGAAERLQDATDDDDVDEESEGEPESADLPSAFDVFAQEIRGQPGWGEIKSGLNRLSVSADWKADMAARSPFRIRAARVSAAIALAALINAGKEPADLFVTDLSAFRCWVEMVEDADMILEAWPTLVQSPAYDALEATQRTGFEGVVKARIALLQAGPGSALA